MNMKYDIMPPLKKKCKPVVIEGLKDTSLEMIISRKQIKERVAKIASKLITSRMIDRNKVNLLIGLQDGCSPFFEDLLDELHHQLGDRVFNEYIILQSKITISLYGKEFQPNIDRLDKEEEEFELLDSSKQLQIINMLQTYISVNRHKINIIFIDDVFETGSTLTIVNYWFKNQFKLLNKLSKKIKYFNVTFITKFPQVHKYQYHLEEIQNSHLDFNKIFSKFNTNEDLITLPDLSGINCPKESWLVGYGMDLDFRFRNIKSIFKLIKTNEKEDVE